MAKCGCLGCRATGCISDGVRERCTAQGRPTEARRNGWMPGGARTTRASSKFLRTFGGSLVGALPGATCGLRASHAPPTPAPFLRAPCGSLPLRDGRCCSSSQDRQRAAHVMHGGAAGGPQCNAPDTDSGLHTNGSRSEQFYTYMVRREMQATEDRILERVLVGADDQVCNVRCVYVARLLHAHGIWSEDATHWERKHD